MRMTLRRNGYWVTVVTGDYGTEDRRIQLREEGARRGRYGRRSINSILFEDGLKPPERQELLNRWVA